MNLAQIQAGLVDTPRPAAPRPLLPAALGLGLGIILDNYLAPSVAFPIGIAAVALLLIPLAPRVVKPALGGLRSDHAHWLTLVFATAACLGMLRHALADRYLPASHIAHHLQSEPILTTLTGEITTTPYIKEPDPDVPLAFPRHPSTRFYLRAEAVAGVEGPLGVIGVVAVNVKSPRLDLQVGQNVTITGWLARPRGPRNPDDFDWARHLRREGIFATLTCDHGESARINASSASVSSRLERLLTAARTRLRGYLTDDAFEVDDPAAGVLSAIILGHRSAVPKAMNEAFLVTGNAHLLAASGMQVAWLALVVWTLARLFGLYYRPTAVLVAAVIISYVLIAEPRPSILRAGIVGVLSCAAAFFRGRYGSVNALSAAAIIILLIRPGDLFSAAFQFTFLATVGLLYFCPLVSERIAEFFLNRNLPTLARAFNMAPYALSLFKRDTSVGSWPRRILRWLGVATAQLFALSLAEWLLTAPLSCYLFNNFMPWGWAGTFIVSLIAIPANIVGYLMVLTRLIFPSAGVFLGPILAWTTNAMLWTVDLLAHLPGSVVNGRSPSLAWVLVCYALIAWWCYQRRRPPEAAEAVAARSLATPFRRFNFSTFRRLPPVFPRRAFSIVTPVLLLWWLLPLSWASGGRSALNVWMMAVGDGTGTVIQLPDGRTLLYDFGTRSSFDALPIVRNFLHRRGITRLDGVFISHTDFDHFSALERLASEVEFASVYINDHFERFAAEKPAPRNLLSALRNRGIPIEVSSAPRAFDEFADVQLEMLWPPPIAERRLIEDNDASTVLRMTYQGKSILLTGDITEAAMASLMSIDAPTADVLTLPHHGSVVGNTAAFINRVNPRVAVRSTGQRKALTTNGICEIVGNRLYLSTADDGCVHVRIDDGGLTVKTIGSEMSARFE